MMSRDVTPSTGTYPHFFSYSSQAFCPSLQVASARRLCLHFTLFLWDINEQKNCQNFQCGFSYLDSFSKALTERILDSNDRFRICLLSSTANPAHFHQTWAGLAVLVSRQILNRSLEFEILFVRASDKLFKQKNRHQKL